MLSLRRLNTHCKETFGKTLVSLDNPWHMNKITQSDKEGWDVVIQFEDKSINLWWKIKIHQHGQMSH